MKALTEDSFTKFWQDLHTVSQVVYDKLTTTTAHDLRRLTIDVRARCDHGMKDRTLRFAEQLLDQLAETSVGRLYSYTEKGPQWFNNYLNSGVCTLDAEFAASRIEEFLMEQLTAVWLVLYFLSMPMGHPWERVRRIADEQGGYPAGACMTKMIGDVYRRSRLEFLDVKPDNGSPPPPHVLVLSMYPSILIKDLLIRKDDTKVTPAALHVLGRCYALFQLRLYVSERHSMRYIVTVPALKDCWELFPSLPALTTSDAARHITDWLALIFPEGQISGQDVLLHRGKSNLKMSPCALGYKSGVYALESGADGTRFVGNRVNKKLLRSLRHRLVHETSSDIVPLVGISNGDLNDVLR